MKNIFRTLIAIGTLGLALTANAQTSNPASATAGSSSGDSLITLTLTPFIFVNNFNDIDLTASANGDVFESDNLCVGGFGYSEYSVAFGSDNGTADAATPTAGTLLLSDGGSDEIAYSVGFAKGASAVTADETSTDGAMTNHFARDPGDTITLCQGGGENATLFVYVAATDWQEAEGTSYTDTLTVQVSAE